MLMAIYFGLELFRSALYVPFSSKSFCHLGSISFGLYLTTYAPPLPANPDNSGLHRKGSWHRINFSSARFTSSYRMYDLFHFSKRKLILYSSAKVVFITHILTDQG